MYEELTERERRVLQLLVTSYIKWARPIGSEAASGLYSSPISSATIRNVFMRLDAMGYLEQPHTSAGRVPTEKAYRFYVDTLMLQEPLADADRDDVETVYEECESEMDRMIEVTPRLLSRMTHNAGLVFRPDVRAGCFKSVQVIPISAVRVIVVLIMTNGTIKKRLMSIPEGISQGELSRAEKFLNDGFEGQPVESVSRTISARLEALSDSFHATAGLALELMKAVSSGEGAWVVHLEGRDYILEQPEFKDMDETRKLFRLLEAKKELAELLRRDFDEEGLKIYIGTENIYEDIQNCSMVACSYKVGNVFQGRLAVIGPMRMEYPRVITSVKLVARSLERCLEILFGGE